jgi:hypothetical protein
VEQRETAGGEVRVPGITEGKLRVRGILIPEFAGVHARDSRRSPEFREEMGCVCEGPFCMMGGVDSDGLDKGDNSAMG